MQTSLAITKKSSSNLALAFVLLPKPKRDGMSALYAFCREVDDIADDESIAPELRRARLAEWREDIGKACNGQTPRFAVNAELQPFIASHHLAFEHFDELIRGVEMDLEIKRYNTFESLDLYCYRVASVVGLLSIEIFGYTNPASREYAIHLGKALQLTNILRDVKTDAERGRIYLPLSELSQAKVSEEEILQGQFSSRYYNLASSVAHRATTFYQQANATLPEEDRRSMIAAELMGSVYWKLLRKLESEQFNVFKAETTRLSKGHKVLLILRTWYRLLSRAPVPNYGSA